MAANPSSIPITELFWSLLDKADRKFSLLRDLPSFSRNRNDLDFHKAFKIYTQLWKMQQEHRQKLTDAGLKRWEVGELASRIAQLYYGQYQRTSDSSFLSEAFIFYEAILSREYFRDASSSSPDPALANKQLRFLARFLIVCLLLGRRDMVSRLASQLRVVLDECKKNFQETDFKEWKHVVQEIFRFMKVDTPFINMRPLRYSFVYDSNPNSLSVPSHTNRRLVLRDSILSTYHHNEVKFTELTIDTYRMVQCLEWEPCGSFSLKGGANSGHNESGPNRVNLLQDIRDPSLPPNPRKVILYRPSITHYLMVLATVCEELPSDGILLIYLSAPGGLQTVTLSSGSSPDTVHRIAENSDGAEMASPINSPSNSPRRTSFHENDNQKTNSEAALWLGSRGAGGSKYLYPCDLIPFTRKPIFLVIDSDNSHAFKVIHGAEKRETIAMLLSPISQLIGTDFAPDSMRHQHGSYFTLFLTAPLQAFCLLVNISGMNMEKDTYNKAEKLLSSSLSEWESTLLTSDSLHPVWVEALGDPFLRRLLLRYIFCRTVYALYAKTFRREEFSPTCLPHLPDSVLPEETISQTAVLRLANMFNVKDYFAFSDGIVASEVDENESTADEC
ncbi:protein SCAI [Dioscorea cayenensis subsp. rotundata]|uniref:Protein SCAI n=1 Tax=Dioscorea cayennensis subsp. rotundata TaxID=55577 RepID=A0AB40BC73_DIOCR|nr:protein SCAI [Dioscorea cayenensis subsp. rotundata]